MKRRLRATPPRRRAGAATTVLAAAVLAVAVAASSASAATTTPNQNPTTKPKPAPPDRAPACNSQCAATVTACRASKKAQKPDAQAIAAMTAAFGCGGAAVPNRLRSPVCQDLALVLLDLLHYETSPYNSDDGGDDDQVPAAVLVDNGAGGKTPCPACSGKQDACDLLHQICLPFCLNDRRTQEEWQVVGGGNGDGVVNNTSGAKAGAVVAVNGRASPLPRYGNRTVLFQKATLNTVETQTHRLGLSVAAVVLTTRPPKTRASVHYHASTSVSCVLEGCTTLTMPGGVDRAQFCARDKKPACYMMPPYQLILNENTGPGELRLLDFFHLEPLEASFYSVEAGSGGGRDVSSGKSLTP